MKAHFLHIKSYHTIVIIAMILSAASIFAVYSLTGELLEQVIFIVIGGLVMWLFAKINYVKLNQFSNLALVAALVLLIITLIFGTGGAGRSIVIANRYIQTFYPIAFLVIFYLINYVAVKAKHGEKLTRNEAIYALSVLGIFCVCIALRNMSTALLLFGTGMVVMFVAEVRLKYLAIFLLVGAIGGGCYIGIGSIKEKKEATELSERDTKDRGSTVANRIKYWLTEESDTKGYGKQMTLAKAAVSRSVVAPTGPGKGILKKSMPEGENDFVFALICEELSLFVGLIILVAYIFLFNISFNIAKEAKGPFAKLYAIGIGTLIAGQGLIHIGANVGVIPATGQTLPFISKGGVTLIVSCIAIGILLNVSKRAKIGANEDEEQAD